MQRVALIIQCHHCWLLYIHHCHKEFHFNFLRLGMKKISFERNEFIILYVNVYIEYFCICLSKQGINYIKEPGFRISVYRSIHKNMNDNIWYPIRKIYFRNNDTKMTLSKLFKFDILKYHTSLSLNLQFMVIF